jgi:hypothetical protein
MATLLVEVGHYCTDRPVAETVRKVIPAAAILSAEQAKRRVQGFRIKSLHAKALSRKGKSSEQKGKNPRIRL